jgi:hypothetical protein
MLPSAFQVKHMVVKCCAETAASLPVTRPGHEGRLACNRVWAPTSAPRSVRPSVRLFLRASVCPSPACPSARPSGTSVCVLGRDTVSSVPLSPEQRSGSNADSRTSRFSVPGSGFRSFFLLRSPADEVPSRAHGVRGVRARPRRASAHTACGAPQTRCRYAAGRGAPRSVPHVPGRGTHARRGVGDAALPTMRSSRSLR